MADNSKGFKDITKKEIPNLPLGKIFNLGAESAIESQIEEGKRNSGEKCAEQKMKELIISKLNETGINTQMGRNPPKIEVSLSFLHRTIKVDIGPLEVSKEKYKEIECRVKETKEEIQQKIMDLLETEFDAASISVYIRPDFICSN